MQPVEIIPAGNTLGEGIQWDVATQTVWWTDIHEKRIHRYDPSTRKLDGFAMRERVGSFALMERSDRIIAALESGFALVDLNGGAPQWLGRPDAELGGVRFNDGRVDRQGRFWAGTMEEPEPRTGRGNLYCVGPDGTVRHRESGVAISNGLAWSPDGTRMYFADSPLRTIYCYDFDTASGQISNRRVFARTPQGAHPDGATVDSEGFLWSAHWGAGMVVRYRSDGTVDHVLQVPASQPTCVAFGGPELDLMFVTSARDGLSAEALAIEPSAGSVFVYKMNVKGLPDRRYV